MNHEEFIQDVIEGAGWCTFDYIFQQPMSGKEAMLAATELIDQGRVYTEDDITLKQFYNS